MQNARTPTPTLSLSLEIDLPYLTADTISREACEQYLKGECVHGISGELNGTCEKLNLGRCNKYMKWGKRHDKGCKMVSCDKAHPILCDRSHDLKCFVQNCPFKLHTQKCVRDRHPIDIGGVRQQRSVSRGSVNPWINGSAQPKPQQSVPDNAADMHAKYQQSVGADGGEQQSPAGRCTSDIRHQTNFQGLTVLQMLEAQLKMMQLELNRQR